MKKWLQQLMIISVAFVTLGVISPSHEIWDSLHEKENIKQPGLPESGSAYSVSFETTFERDPLPAASEDELISGARKLAYTKFGTKIGPAIGDEFDTVIFPEMERVIRDTFGEQFQMDRKLAISERPSGGHAEKIFNIKDAETDKNLLLFHVRTEKRPQDGYFFNFHYHVAADDYETHHTIGEVYWSKNTPPKWLS
ncbi:YpjP family protein [Sporosarcina koreensis]|nr:YpjP family protein [Sporosarcina koreensis]